MPIKVRDSDDKIVRRSVCEMAADTGYTIYNNLSEAISASHYDGSVFTYLDPSAAAEIARNDAWERAQSALAANVTDDWSALTVEDHLVIMDLKERMTAANWTALEAAYP